MTNLYGKKISSSAELEIQIDNLVEKISTLTEDINDIKEPSAILGDEIGLLIKEYEGNRGRPMFYPYIGSGSGKGALVELEDGSIKLDLINGIGINILGHSHPEIIKASLKGSLQDVTMQGNLQPSKEMIFLQRKLVSLANKNSALNHSWLTTSGSMANENALKMCRQKTNGSRMLIAMDAAFAGRTTMMAEVTDNDTMRVGLPRYNEILRVPFYDKDNPKSIENSVSILKEHLEKHKGDICGFMFEPLQGEGGFKVAPREFFVPLLDLCKEHKVPVWADEIQTFCRTGEFFAFETLGLGEYIDICTIAKTLQGAATLYTDELNPKPGLIAGTFAGSTVGLSSGLAVLNYLETHNYMGKDGRVVKLHNEFVSMLQDLKETTCKGLIQDVEGLGLMVAMTPLDGSKEKMLGLLKALYKNGLIAFGCGRGPFRVRFLLPATLTSHEIQIARKVIEKSLQGFS
ncbi:MAG: aminotransferase class III-fold pyridoxal phosphate-dependent enzyme [Bdellovibrionaceae bacterium]|jgi:4-aminobutyrate aminotransferase-like enzyme|nr:aminotransferase class III-fold pyridoxal phosphate-dependent enzyme [Pseudobdellovibrionaceae bacterium]